MHRVLAILRSVRRDTLGATMVEYGLIVALIAVGIMVALTATGTSINGVFTTVSDKMPDG